MTQLEEDRFVAMKRTQRLEQELSAKKKVSYVVNRHHQQAS